MQDNGFVPSMLEKCFEFMCACVKFILPHQVPLSRLVACIPVIVSVGGLKGSELNVPSHWCLGLLGGNDVSVVSKSLASKLQIWT